MSQSRSNYFSVAPNVWGMKLLFVNIYMIADDDHWVLIDAGLLGSAGRILKMAADLFGNQPPAAIILTHGHFDHRGALETLLQTWDVPVYAHVMELPYLTGLSSYPPTDPSVGGGLMSLLSVLYPRQPLDLGTRIQQMPKDSTVPYLPDWLSVDTPGHSPGHISLFRSKDKLLIAGDAFVTTKQESALATFLDIKQLNGPPKYFTPDWEAAKSSVIKLRNLHPVTAATGHGKPMTGKQLQDGLDNLVNHFEQLAVPSSGRYIREPATADKHGVRTIPPENAGVNLLSVIALSACAAFAFALYARKKP